VAIEDVADSIRLMYIVVAIRELFDHGLTLEEASETGD
jgi:acyl carrier protein